MNVGRPGESHRDYPMFNNRRLLGPIGNIPPAEAEENFYAQRDVLDMVA
jgi:transposase InsO family protein